jgi:hypothetical protein
VCAAPLFRAVFAPLAGNTLVDPPLSADSPGHLGQVAVDATYFYKCVAPNQWERLPLSALASW